MYKAALVIQGGGMRGVYASGVLDYLMEQNIDLEAVFGVSAGAKNSQYYISKQIGEALKVDLFCINNKKAISFHNLLFNGGVINADYYNNYIMKEIAPINDNFYKNENKFYAGATNLITGEEMMFDAKEYNLRDVITASCSIPVVQRIKYIDNIPYLDGGVAESIPLNSALKKGYQKIVVILTREKDMERKEDKDDHFQNIYRFAYKKYPLFLNQLLTMNSRHNNLLDKIKKLEEEGKIFCIYPSKKPDIGMLENNKEKVLDLYNLGYQDAKNLKDDLIKYLEE